MSVESWLRDQPIAHRGFYENAQGVPQNSLAAFRRAVAHGIPFEFDVQDTVDGCPVVWHDAAVPLPDGRTVALRHLTSRQLAHVRLGDTEEPIPTLGQVLETVDGKVPMVVDVRRWVPDWHGSLERTIAAHLRDYAGPAAVQSFDPLAVFRLRRLTDDRPIGQASGELHSANAVVAAVGRTMPTNAVTRPDFISYEITRMPSFWTTLWRRRGVPVLAFPVDDESDEQRAREVADNFFFANYIPSQYRSPDARSGV
ncbi:glycerophosphodiester phosphodiesterase family protein [Geodermatophilus sp. URMC 61]|uniref:glycerophosphodiester phosphodiesterase family protein n=1 Tax=Geodermatophilus sp. URMC 61 TaxID=3423411 RepID=UPI00406BE5FF